MKKAFILPLMAISTVISFASCSDDDKDIHTSNVPTEVTTAFKAMFPNASKVSWEQKSNYYVADFDENRIDNDAWFESNGNWAMTVSDYGHNVAVLPEAVSQVIGSDLYVNYTVDDIDLYKRTADSFYVIELDGKNVQDVDLIISPEGNIIKNLPDNGKDYKILPTTDVSKL